MSDTPVDFPIKGHLAEIGSDRSVFIGKDGNLPRTFIQFTNGEVVTKFYLSPEATEALKKMLNGDFSEAKPHKQARPKAKKVIQDYIWEFVAT